MIGPYCCVGFKLCESDHKVGYSYKNPSTLVTDEISFGLIKLRDKLRYKLRRKLEVKLPISKEGRRS